MVRQNRKHLPQEFESKFPLDEKTYCRHGLVLACAYQENVVQVWASAGTYLLWKRITEHSCHSVKLLFHYCHNKVVGKCCRNHKYINSWLQLVRGCSWCLRYVDICLSGWEDDSQVLEKGGMQHHNWNGSRQLCFVQRDFDVVYHWTVVGSDRHYWWRSPRSVRFVELRRRRRKSHSAIYMCSTR